MLAAVVLQAALETAVEMVVAEMVEQVAVGMGN
jgi:hypothetical protein